MNWDWFIQQKKRYPGLKWQDLQQLWQHYKGDITLLDDACEKLHDGKPIEYLLSCASFGPLTLEICAPLLIPRPETWDWIEQFLPTVQPKNVLDLGCGPGTLGTALAYFHPHQAALTSVDINPIALKQAEKNLANRALLKKTYIESDWFKKISSTQKFDLIMSNPPYCAEEERSWIDAPDEDYHALFAGMGGLEAYHIILKDIFNYLDLNGVIIFEHGASQGGSLIQLLKLAQITHWQQWYDKMGAWRATSFRKP